LAALRLFCQSLVKTFALESRIAATLLRHGQGSRRPQICGFFCDRLVTFLLAVGAPLGDVQREVENGLEFARKAKFGYVVDIIIGQLRFIRTLRGLPRASSPASAL